MHVCVKGLEVKREALYWFQAYDTLLWLSLPSHTHSRATHMCTSTLVNLADRH